MLPVFSGAVVAGFSSCSAAALITPSRESSSLICISPPSSVSFPDTELPSHLQALEDLIQADALPQLSADSDRRIRRGHQVSKEGMIARQSYTVQAALATASEDGKTAARMGRSQFSPEKAKQLRAALRKSHVYHDTMYHSGLASRMAEEL